MQYHIDVVIIAILRLLLRNNCMMHSWSVYHSCGLAAKMGYGSRALQLLQDYFEGHIANLSETEMEVESVNRVDKVVSFPYSRSRTAMFTSSMGKHQNAVVSTCQYAL